jgi:hypothetical protein
MRQMSFYKLRLVPPKSYDPVDTRMTGFGDSFSMVKEQQLVNWLKENGDFEVQSGECIYANENQHNGSWGSFYKSLDFDYQKERRLILKCKTFDCEVKNDPLIQNKLEQSIDCGYASCDNTLPKQARFDAHRKCKQIESEIETLKAEFCEKLNAADDYLSDIYPLSDLLSNIWTLL